MRRINGFFLLLLLSSFGFGQIHTTVKFSSYQDDNLYRSPQPIQDLVSGLGIHLNYLPANSNMNYYYDGNYIRFNAKNDRNFYTHSLGLNYQTNFGKEEKNTFYLGGELTGRFDSETYSYYDYSQFYGYLNARYNLDFMFLKAGYNLRYRRYANIPDLTNTRHYLFVQGNKSFSTRTSLILEADLGYKSFAGQDYLLSGGGRGHGRMMTDNSSTVAEIPSLSQAVFLFRVAQSLHEKIGLYVQYRKQISLGGGTSYVNGNDYYQDEELFDDPFSFESDAFSSQLTWIFPWAVKLKLGGAFTAKSYISETAYESASDSLASGGIRSDDQKTLYLNLSKKFFVNKSWLNSLELSLNYNYIRNASNSYWYDYKNNMLGGSLKWNF